MNIDPSTGTVTLPNGCSIDPGLSQDEFRESESYALLCPQDGGRASWNQYRGSGGRLEDKEVLVVLRYQDQNVASLDLTVDLYPPGPRDWSSYSLDVEAATKEFHDGLVEQSLGPPSQSDHLSFMDLPPSQEALRCPKVWTFPWGTVHSVHDFKGGGTLITLQYLSRPAGSSQA